MLSHTAQVVPQCGCNRLTCILQAVFDHVPFSKKLLGAQYELLYHMCAAVMCVNAVGRGRVVPCGNSTGDTVWGPGCIFYFTRVFVVTSQTQEEGVGVRWYKWLPHRNTIRGETVCIGVCGGQKTRAGLWLRFALGFWVTSQGVTRGCAVWWCLWRQLHYVGCDNQCTMHGVLCASVARNIQEAAWFAMMVGMA